MLLNKGLHIVCGHKRKGTAHSCYDGTQDACINLLSLQRSGMHLQAGWDTLMSHSQLFDPTIRPNRLISRMHVIYGCAREGTAQSCFDGALNVFINLLSSQKTAMCSQVTMGCTTSTSATCTPSASQ